MSHGLVHAPRRPPGWSPPGPRARGPAGRPELWPAPDEDLRFLSGDWRIFQKLEGHRSSLDDLATAGFAIDHLGDRAPRHALDLGCGTGSVLMMIAWRFPDARLLGVEAQETSVALARRSLAYNGAEERVRVEHADLRDPGVPDEPGAFDLVTGTPPFLPPGDGPVSEVAQRRYCRFELRGGIEAYCRAAARALAPSGRFAICHPDIARTEAAAEAAGLTVLERRDVVARHGRPPRFTLFWMARAADARDAGPCRIAEAMVVRERDGGYGAAYRALRESMGMPPGDGAPRPSRQLLP